jgi:hypothetical protein
MQLEPVVPDLGVQQYPGYRNRPDPVLPTGYSYLRGVLDVCDASGLGVDQQACARHPYSPRYLPSPGRAMAA